MTRDVSLDEVIFPVEVRDLYFDNNATQGALFQESRLKRLASHRVVIDVERRSSIGVVGKNYELLTNEKALNIGRRAFAQYFSGVDPNSFQVYNVITPSTRSFCHVDLINHHYRVDRWEQDTWLPYLRVTNSYNTSRAFRLELGFVREACSNGLIFSKETVEVRMSHTRQDLGTEPVVKIEASVERLRTLEAEFVAYLERIRDSNVPRLYALPMIAKSLGLRFEPEHRDPDTRERERARLQEFKVETSELVDRYYEELGANAYAVFNATTDFATHSKGARNRQRVAPLQVKAGQWLREYAELSRRPDFDLDAYVGNYLPVFAGAY